MISAKNEAILGLILIMLGLAVLASNFELFDVGATLLGFLVFGGVGFIFLISCRRGHECWWAIIPAGVMFGLAAVTALEAFEGTPAPLSRAVFLWACAAPFIVLFRRDPRFFWASIPGGFLAFVGLVALLSGTKLGGALLAWLLYWGIGAAFVAVFLKESSRWWAIIPAGAFFSLGIVSLVARTDLGGPSAQGFILNLGLAATFGFLYLIRNETNRLQWARLPAIILLVVSILFLFSALSWDGLVKVLSVALVAVGVYFVLSSRRSKEAGRI